MATRLRARMGSRHAAMVEHALVWPEDGGPSPRCDAARGRPRTHAGSTRPHLARGIGSRPQQLLDRVLRARPG